MRELKTLRNLFRELRTCHDCTDNVQKARAAYNAVGIEIEQAFEGHRKVLEAHRLVGLEIDAEIEDITERRGLIDKTIYQQFRDVLLPDWDALVDRYDSDEEEERELVEAR